MKAIPIKIYKFDLKVRHALKGHIKNKVVLDIGGYDGKQAAWALEQGAKKAISLDNGEYGLYLDWEQKPPFMGVNYIYGNFYHHDRMADVTIFQNVLYHQKNPALALEKVRSLTREMMVLSTSYIEGKEAVFKVFDWAHADENYLTVSWKPTIKGLLTLLENTGWTKNEVISQEEEHVVVRCLL